MTESANRQLVDMLDHVWSSTADLGRTLDETAWKQPTECPGWTVQDNLVHITALERFILGDPLPAADVPDDLPHVKNDIGTSNERWIESRRAWTGEDALEEFRVVTAARLEQLRALDDDGFRADSWTPMGPGTVADLLGFRIFDSWVHEQDMRRAVDAPGDLDSPAAAHALGMMVGVLPYIVGKKVGAPDGSTVVLSLTGPLPRTTAVEVTGGRARPSTPCPTTRPSRSRSRRTHSPASRAAGPNRPRRWWSARSPSTATWSWAARSCASSTTCSEPTASASNRGVPDGSGHQRRAGERVRPPPVAAARLRRRRARSRRPARATSTRRAGSQPCCRVGRSPHPRASRGTTWPQTPTPGSPRRWPRSTTCSTPPARSRTSTARRRSWAGSRRAAGWRSRWRSARATARARPGCSP